VINIEKEYSYRILAIVAIVAIVAIFTMLKPGAYLQTSTEKVDLVGEAIGKKGIAPGSRAMSFTATNIGDNELSVELGWVTVSGADGYILYRKEGVSSYVIIAYLTSEDTGYMDTSANADTFYTYMIEALLLNGETIDSATAAVTTIDNTPPQPVANIVAVDTPNDDGDSITIAWSASPDEMSWGGDINYLDYHDIFIDNSAGCGSPYNSDIVDIGTYAYIWGGLTTNTEYWFMLRTYDASGNYADSDCTSAIPLEDGGGEGEKENIVK